MTSTSDISGLLQALAGNAGRPRSLAANETLFHAGNRVRSLFIVVTGQIRLERLPEPGQTLTLHIAGKGELLAEASIFHARYHCNACALQPSEVLAFDRSAVRTGLRSNAEAAYALAQQLAQQVQQLRTRAALLGTRSAQQRVLAYLETLRTKDSEWIALDKPWTTVATEIGLSHEAVYRAPCPLRCANRTRRITSILPTRADLQCQ